MAQVLVRNLDEEVVGGLRARARLAGQPLEAFLRGLLREAAVLTGDQKVALAEAHQARFAALGPNEDWEALYVQARDERDRRGEGWLGAAGAVPDEPEIAPGPSGS